MHCVVLPLRAEPGDHGAGPPSSAIHLSCPGEVGSSKGVVAVGIHGHPSSCSCSCLVQMVEQFSSNGVLLVLHLCMFAPLHLPKLERV